MCAKIQIYCKTCVCMSADRQTVKYGTHKHIFFFLLFLLTYFCLIAGQKAFEYDMQMHLILLISTCTSINAVMHASHIHIYALLYPYIYIYTHIYVYVWQHYAI